MEAPNGMKKVLCPISYGNNKTYWMRIGKAFPNRDGSTNVYLDAYPSNGKLQIRDLDERDLRPRDAGRGGEGGSDGFDAPDAGNDALPF